MWANFCDFSKKLPKVTNPPMGVNAANLVTLAGSSAFP
jgi:hypothetical protein